MRTQEITREEWNSFFNTFSQQHEGWLATLEIFGPEVGAQKEAHELSLEGMGEVTEGSEDDRLLDGLEVVAGGHGRAGETGPGAPG